VVGGESLVELKNIMRSRMRDAPQGEPTEYDVYPNNLIAPYRDRRYKVGEDMYGHLGIPREDKLARLRWLSRNFQFFGAPLALFCYVDRTMGPPQWSDLGMFLQTVMLLLQEEGIDSCAQECWSTYPLTIAKFLNSRPDHALFTGMAIGYADREMSVNRLVADRAPLEEFAQFRGI
jgi:nitroreductase